MRVHILSPVFLNRTTRAFAFPILRYRSALRNRGITIEFFENPHADNLTMCDVLIVESSYMRQYSSNWQDRITSVQNDLRSYNKEVDKLYWFDTDASTGTLQYEVLPIVDRYYKNQLLRERQRYLEPLYGGRTYTEYYCEHFNIEDSSPQGENRLNRIEDEGDLEKLRVGWNKGLADYSLLHNLTNKVFPRLPKRVFSSFPWDLVMRTPIHWRSASKLRKNNISARFSTGFSRETVAFHRELMVESVEDRLNTKYVHPIQYWRELRDSRVVLSPFGWGELCWRDFETFMAGGLLVKPRMDHLETWPPLFEDDETMVGVEWDMSDLGKTLDRVLANEAKRHRIAREGQERYKSYLIGNDAKERFVARFTMIVRDET